MFQTEKQAQADRLPIQILDMERHHVAQGALVTFEGENPELINKILSKYPLVAVAIIAILEETTLLLLVNHYIRGWELPSGHTISCEDYKIAAIRELKEETGAEPTDPNEIKAVGALIWEQNESNGQLPAPRYPPKGSTVIVKITVKNGQFAPTGDGIREIIEVKAFNAQDALQILNDHIYKPDCLTSLICA